MKIHKPSNPMDFFHSKLTNFNVLFLLLLLSFTSTQTEAYHSKDRSGNITVKWDVIQWTPDGYVAVVSIYNFQHHRQIQKPGWTLGWTWPRREVIWSMIGAQTTEQGDCSKFKGNIPHSCKIDPQVVDLLPTTPYNMQVANCCKGGVLDSWDHDPANALSAFQISVGAEGTTNTTVRLPQSFTIMAPGPGYKCGPAKSAKPSRFISADGRRFTQALMTWNVICTFRGPPSN
ncbi:protein COBRA-like [Magnolia sinica]|uniref:protein COBRA-like n=1 Tax=Magnolia sinica TaxID=86752 RepID=UPI00265B2406|nr:protein COBRA-like [Magnolia sinica]